MYIQDSSEKSVIYCDGWCGWCGAVFCDRPDTDEYANCDECGKLLAENPPGGPVEPREMMGALIGHLDGVVEAIDEAVNPKADSQ